MKTRATIVGLVVIVGITVFLVGRLHAIAVGNLVVQSQRGAPFLAEIPLTLSPREQRQGVIVTLGDAAEYAREGLQRPKVIDRLEASWVSGARDVVLIASTDPVDLPQLDLVVLVQVGPVTIVKTYRATLPVPPPVPSLVTARPTPPRRSRPAPTTARAPRPASPKPSARVTPPAASQDNPPPPAPQWVRQLPRRYGPVDKGATLYGIAQELRIPGESIWQAIVAIWQDNQERFSGGNMHGLQSGIHLTIPADLATRSTSMSRKEAQRIVAEQWEMWQALRQAVSGRQPTEPAREKPAVLTRKPAPEKPEPQPAASAAATRQTEPSPPPATVVLPADKTVPPAGMADLQTVLQGLEQLLSQRLVHSGDVPETVPFVRTAELQTALKGLEDRLTQQLQETLRKVEASQRAALLQQRLAEKTTALDQWFPANSIAYVLVVENALLVLLAAGILWRWFRSRA